jgi:hypothetical protein
VGVALTKGEPIVLTANWKRRSFSLGTACTAIVLLSACIDEVTQPERAGVAAETSAIRLLLNDQPVMTIFEDGKETMGPIVFVRDAVGASASVRAELLASDGTAIPNVSPNDVRINIVTSSSSNLPFTRVDAFSGTLRSMATNPSTYDLTIGLFDMHQRRVVIGPYVVRLTVLNKP